MKKSQKPKRPRIVLTLKKRELDEADLRAIVGGGQTQAHTNDP